MITKYGSSKDSFKYAAFTTACKPVTANIFENQCIKYGSAISWRMMAVKLSVHFLWWLLWVKIASVCLITSFRKFKAINRALKYRKAPRHWVKRSYNLQYIIKKSGKFAGFTQTHAQRGLSQVLWKSADIWWHSAQVIQNSDSNETKGT